MGKTVKTPTKKPDTGEGDQDGFWVFGYGSLMWNPGFPYLEAAPARIFGFRRSLCVISTNYRGTEQNPGLVLGLDNGGSTDGLAFLVADEHINETLAYLDDREQITKVYCPHFACAHLKDGRKVRAYTFVVRHGHGQYAGNLSREETARMIVNGKGERGRSLDYVANTVAHLDELGIKDTELHRVLELAQTLKKAL